MQQRTAGILLHITSLVNRFPIGDLGPAAYTFVDFLCESKQSWWQLLPIGPVGEGNSPYQASSAFGGNPLLVSPERLVEQGFLDKKDIIVPAPAWNDGKVNYSSAKQLKLLLLKKAFKNFEKRKQNNRQFEFDTFTQTESAWLDDFSLFSAIQGKEGTADWTQWERELRIRYPTALVYVKEYLAKDIRYHKFIQWQFALQWGMLWAYCASKGIRLIGDIPLFVTHQSSDVWANPDIFKLDINGKPAVVAGVPPDYFSKTGQIWNVPVYCWAALKAQNYRWWIDRLRTTLRRFDLIRLDHFTGFFRTYEISAQAKSAKQGEYCSGGGRSFFKAIYKILGSLPFIADDLGAVSSEAVRLRNQLEIPGTKVLQFDLDAGDLSKAAHYPANSVVYTSTHDNDTTKGWYQKLPTKQRKALCKHLHTDNSDFNWTMIRVTLETKSNIAIIPMQDVLGLGSEARMNVPGRMNGNWQWRLKKRVLTRVLTKKLQKITQGFERASM